MLQYIMVAAQNAVADLHVVLSDTQVVTQFRRVESVFLYAFQRGIQLLLGGPIKIKAYVLAENGRKVMRFYNVDVVYDHFAYVFYTLEKRGELGFRFLIFLLGNQVPDRLYIRLSLLD